MVTGLMCRGEAGLKKFLVWICTSTPPAVAEAIWTYLDPRHLIIPVDCLAQRLISDDDDASGRRLQIIFSLGTPSGGSRASLAAANSHAPMVIILDDSPDVRPYQPSHPCLRLLLFSVPIGSDMQG